jgi:phospho-N-acetylmuramoyl-pentapeptide-transferase
MLVLILDFIARHLPPKYDLGPWRLLTYITTRTGLALGLSFFISLAIGPRVIAALRALKAGQVIRKAIRADAIDLSAMHGKKSGTPTMGGILMMIAMLLPVVILCRLSNPYVLLLLLMTFGYGLLGFWDDYLKIVRKNHHGVSPAKKILVQTALGIAFGLALMAVAWPIRYDPAHATGYPFLLVPFWKQYYPYLGWWFVALVAVVMMCTSNAVNLTDGLDGLAIGVSITNLLAFTIVAYIASNANYSRYLFVPYVEGGGEIVVFLGALVGASLGFLWFNAHPAEIFMGDTGSMMLGGAIGATAIMLKQELLLVIIGGVFVVEAVSVIIQVGFYKATGRRVFRMSPLHHHFEKLGIHESRIIIRFWIVAWILAIVGLGTLKLR